MNKLRILIFVIVTSLLGCHHGLKNPETKDPIYLELVKERDGVLTSLTSLKSEVEKAKLTYDEAPIRTGQRQDAEADYFDLKGKEQKLMEKYRYLALSVESKAMDDQKLYKEAFSKGSPWPNPQDFQDFALEERLKNAPREWSPHIKDKSRTPTAEKLPAEDHD